MIRPKESSGIDESLRIRLEGTIEVLEDSLRELDSITLLMGREGLGDDEVGTLQGCLEQLPRIDEAIERASKHEQAAPLGREARARLQKAHAEANVRLAHLGLVREGSLRGAISAVIASVKRQPALPRPGERTLIESRGIPWQPATAVGWAACLLGIVGSSVPLGLVMGALAFVITLLVIPSRPWILTPDRLFIPPRKWVPGRQILPFQIEGMTIAGTVVTVRLAHEDIHLRTTEPRELVSLLCLLKGDCLAWLDPTETWSIIANATDEKSEEPGRALIGVNGVLFVPNSRVERLLSALWPEKLSAPPALDEVLKLMNHVPADRWPRLSEYLSRQADVRRFPRQETVVAEAGDGIRLSAGAHRVRLEFTRLQHPEDRALLRDLLKRLSE